jgi:hypothetical protein
MQDLGGQSGTGTGFLRVLQFPLILIPPPVLYSSSSSSSSSSSKAGTIGQIVANLPSGLISSHPKKLKKTNIAWNEEIVMSADVTVLTH